MRNRKKVYIQGKGFADISRSLLNKIISSAAQPAQNFLKSALKSGAEVAGDKVGSYVASRITEKALPTNHNSNIKAIEELEAKIRADIANASEHNANASDRSSYTGRGFKKIK